MAHAPARFFCTAALVALLFVTLNAAAQIPALPSTGSTPLMKVEVADPPTAMAPGLARALLVNVTMACPLAASAGGGARVDLNASSTGSLIIVPPPAVNVLFDPANCQDGFARGAGFVLAYPAPGTLAGTRHQLDVTARNGSVTATGSTNITVSFAGSVRLTLKGVGAPVNPGATTTYTAETTYLYNGPGKVHLKLIVPEGATAADATTTQSFTFQPGVATPVATHAFTVNVPASTKGSDLLLTLEARVVSDDGVEIAKLTKANARLTIVEPTPEPKGVDEKDTPAPAFALVAVGVGLAARVMRRGPRA